MKNPPESLSKGFLKALLLSFILALFYTLAQKYGRPFLPEMSDRFFNRLVGAALVLPVLGLFLLRQRFFKNMRSNPKVDSTQVMKVRVEVGGLVKLKKTDASIDFIDLVEKWLTQHVKMAELPKLLEKGELQFTEAENDYDLLLDFIELEDGSGKILETLIVDAGNLKQIDFVQKLGNCKLEWHCDHVNRG
ncbi:hypothetical protein IPG41_05565 [Candidatus Peregrinibacteria bacterium]|nr:MAG: hypothetical protein IPG41_05565 [Candidatus Peregrinibacteria bacterium]